MPTAVSARRLAAALPGVWNVRASNLLLWLDEERIDPTFTYDAVTESPLVLNGHVSFRTREGKHKVVSGQSRWKRDRFVWRGNGILKPVTSVWSVAGMNDEATIAVLRYRKTFTIPAGLDVIVRDDADVEEVRTLVSQHSTEFGLTLEDFACLNWLPERG